MDLGSLIALVLAISSPLITAVINAWHQQEMKKIDVFTHEQEIRSKHIDEYLHAAGSAIATLRPSSVCNASKEQSEIGVFVARSASVIMYLDDDECQKYINRIVDAVEGKECSAAYQTFFTLSSRLAELEAERTRELAQVLHRPGMLQSLHFRIVNHIRRFQPRRQRKGR